MTNRPYISTKLIAALLWAGVSCGGCSDSPVVIESRTYESPNSTWIATLEEVDNGLGFGLGAVYNEVHLGKQGEAIGDHGDKSESGIFYVESTYSREKPVKVKWLSNDHIQITYDGSLVPGKKLTAFKGVAIDYEPIQSESGPNPPLSRKG